jgi:hypothetical protein
MPCNHCGFPEASGDILFNDRKDTAGQCAVLGQELRGWVMLILALIRGLRAAGVADRLLYLPAGTLRNPCHAGVLSAFSRHLAIMIGTPLLPAASVTSGRNTCAKHERRTPLWRCPVLGFRRARGDLDLPLPRLSKANRIILRGGRGGAEGSIFRPRQASNFH